MAWSEGPGPGPVSPPGSATLMVLSVCGVLFPWVVGTRKDCTLTALPAPRPGLTHPRISKESPEEADGWAELEPESRAQVLRAACGSGKAPWRRGSLRTE